MKQILLTFMVSLFTLMGVSAVPVVTASPVTTARRFAALDVVQSDENSAAFTASVNITVTLTAGNSVVVFGHNVNAGNNTRSCSDDDSNSYTEVKYHASGVATFMCFASNVNGGSTTITMTVDSAGTNFVTATMIEVEGEIELNGTPVDATGSTGLGMNAGTITTDDAPNLLVAGFAKRFGSGATFSGWTQHEVISDGVEATATLLSNPEAASGADACEATEGAGNDQEWSGVCGAFIESGGGSPPPVIIPFNNPIIFRSGLGQRANLADNIPNGGGGGGGDVIEEADITYMGGFNVPTSGNDFIMANIIMTGRRVGGVPHLLISQNLNATIVQPYSFAEIIVPSSSGYHVTPGSANTATMYRNWGQSGGSSYDMYQGLYGKTYDSGGSLENVEISQYSANMLGAFFTEQSSTCCLLVQYGPQYAAYRPVWGTVIVDLTTLGTAHPTQTGLATSAVGPLRFCVGDWPFGGSEVCGPLRANSMVHLPGGVMGIVQARSDTQQDMKNKGPSLHGGLAYPNLSTTIGFGSTRNGNAYYRTTDVVPSTHLLSHYSLDNHTNTSGFTTGGTPVWTMRRPPHSGGDFTNYVFDDYDCADPGESSNSGEVDPDNYSGIGSATSNDGISGSVYVDGTKTGFITVAKVDVGHSWYKTRHCLDFYRDASEARTIALEMGDGLTGVGGNTSNDDMVFIAKTFSAGPGAGGSNLHRVRFVNGGASQSLSVSLSTLDLTINLATNGSSVVTSTAAQVKAAVEANGPANAAFTVQHYDVSDGSGVVDAFDWTKLAGGPQLCPLHGVFTATDVTGPVSTRYEQAFIIYDLDDLPGSPIYSPEPTSWVWFDDLEANMAFSTDPVNLGETNGIWWDSVDRRIYVLAQRFIASNPFPFVHVFQVAGSSTPSPAQMAARRLKEFNKAISNSGLLVFVAGGLVVALRRKS